MHRLENGGAVLGQATGARLYAGTTTSQSTKPIIAPVFKVGGAANTAYLRACVGDLYETGPMAQLDPIACPTLPKAVSANCCGSSTPARRAISQRCPIGVGMPPCSPSRQATPPS